MNYYCQNQPHLSRQRGANRRPASRLRGTRRKGSRFGGVRRWYWLIVGVLVMGLIGGPWVWQRGTIQGVPISILVTFLMDEPARSAYFSGNLVQLHDRLGELGVEEAIKAFYRPSIPDEVELDRFIHQLMYDRTGYIGKSYKVGHEDQLWLITTADRQFPSWFDTAQEVGLVTNSREEDGVWYVQLLSGEWVLYTLMANQFPTEQLNKYLNCTRKRERQLQNPKRNPNKPQPLCESFLWS